MEEISKPEIKETGIESVEAGQTLVIKKYFLTKYGVPNICLILFLGNWTK